MAVGFSSIASGITRVGFFFRFPSKGGKYCNWPVNRRFLLNRDNRSHHTIMMVGTSRGAVGCLLCMVRTIQRPKFGVD